MERKKNAIYTLFSNNETYFNETVTCAMTDTLENEVDSMMGVHNVLSSCDQSEHTQPSFRHWPATEPGLRCTTSDSTET